MAPWLVLLLYPVVNLLIAQPRAFRLARERRPGLMGYLASRELLQQELEDTGRWLLIGKLLFAAVILLAWMKWCGLSVTQLGVFSVPLGLAIPEGLVAGALLVCGRVAFLGLVHRLPFAPQKRPKHPQSKGPVAIWLLTLVVGVAFEEPWRACCLLAFTHSGWSQTFGVTVTSIAFVHAQMSGFPARIPGANFEDIWAFIVGALLGVLFFRSGTVIVPFVASLSYTLTSFALTRGYPSSSSMHASTP